MDDLRALLATLLFAVSCYLFVDLFRNGFSWIVLGASLGGFVLVHYFWPSKNEGESSWYDSFEFLFDIPYRIIAMFFRGLGRSVRDTEVDIGIDP